MYTTYCRNNKSPDIFQNLLLHNHKLQVDDTIFGSLNDYNWDCNGQEQDQGVRPLHRKMFHTIQSLKKK